MKTLLILALGFGLASPIFAADKGNADQLGKRVDDINALVAKPANMQVALQRISTETGMPVDRLKQQHQRHPEIGVGGLMVANVMADETKKGPETFLSEKAAGKKWSAIAREHKVPIEGLNERLDRLERAIKGEK